MTEKVENKNSLLRLDKTSLLVIIAASIEGGNKELKNKAEEALKGVEKGDNK